MPINRELTLVAPVDFTFIRTPTARHELRKLRNMTRYSREVRRHASVVG